jgi:hypothetical protein
MKGAIDMVFRAELYNPNQGEANAVRMEFPIKDYGKAYDALRHIGIGSAIAQDCQIKSIEGDYSALEVLAGANANVDELDYLAKRLDSFWGAEATQFGAAAAARGIENIEDFINLTFSCQTVTVVSDFSDLEAVGKAHFLNKNGGGVPTSAMEGVDFKQEALDLLQSGKGMITPCGLVFDNGMEIEQLYKGGEFPPYLHEPPVAVLWVKHESTPDASPTCLYLPMQKECMDRALERGGWIDDWSDMTLEFEAHTAPGELFRTIDTESENPAQLNEMAQAINSVIRGNKAKLCAAVEMAEPPDAHSLGVVARNIDLFSFYPDVTDAEAYGRALMDADNLYQQEIEDYIDFERYGDDQMLLEKGEFVEGGYISYCGGVPLEKLMGGQDVSEQGMEMGGM